MTRRPMGKPPAFQWYATDWLSDGKIALWTLAAKGAFIDLLCVQWKEGSIPEDPVQLAKLLRVDGRTFAAVWRQISDRFSQVSPNNLANIRLEDSRKKLISYAESRSNNAKSKGSGAACAEHNAPSSSSSSSSSSKDLKNIAETTAPLAGASSGSGSPPAARGPDSECPPTSGNDPAMIRQRSGKHPAEVNRSEVKGSEENTRSDLRSPAEVKKEIVSSAKNVLVYLSESRKRVRPRSHDLEPTSGNLKVIMERLREGYTEEDCKIVVDQCLCEVTRTPDGWKWFDAVSPYRPENFVRKLNWGRDRKETGGNLDGDDGYEEQVSSAKISQAQRDVENRVLGVRIEVDPLLWKYMSPQLKKLADEHNAKIDGEH